MSGFTDTFGGNTIAASDPSYLALALTADTTLEWPLDAATGSTLAARIIDITPTGAYTITMPDATLVGTGTTTTFYNAGASDVDIVDSAGGAILTISAGETWVAYITDNSTAAGSWRTFQMGASTAQAQASSLEGAGIEASGSALQQKTMTSTINTSPYTFVTTERAQGFVWTGALGTFNLPAVASAGNGWFIHVRNGGTGDLTIDPSSSETINDNTTLTMSPGDSAVLITDGNEWWTIGMGQQAVFAFDYTTIDLAGQSGTYTLSGSELNRIAYKFTGALAGNITIVFPASVQQYWVDNQATGYTLGMKASGGATTTNISSGSRGIYYTDGSEVIKADTTSGIATPISISDGGTNATSAASARSNLSAAASGANSDITGLTGLSAGSVSGASFAKTGDANTGIFFPADDAFAIAVGGYYGLKMEETANAAAITSLGVQALQTAHAASGSNLNSTAVGAFALTAMTTGGDRNTAIGNSAGVSITTGDNNTCLGFEADAASATSSNSVTLGDGNVTSLRCNQTTISSLSDRRDKSDIADLGLGLDFIMSVRPVSFTWTRRDGTMAGRTDLGFIAQELDEAQNASGEAERLRLVLHDNPEKLEADHVRMFPVLVKAVQELAARVEVLENG